jgi:deoxyribodipyrimidine photolyase-related protein
VSAKTGSNGVRNLVVVLGDQLNIDAAAFDGFDPQTDAVWMAELASEAEFVWSHQARIVMFIAAMRHFRANLLARGFPVHYVFLDDAGNPGTLTDALSEAVATLEPQRLVMCQAGEWRVHEAITTLARRLHVALEIRPDRHFLCTPERFEQHASGRKQLRLEFFYRDLRRQTGVLMEGAEPVGGQWNFDAANRRALPKSGPEGLPPPRAFAPDRTTNEVIKLVRERFAGHPGSLDHFSWPVTSAAAQSALEDFIEHRLPRFGDYQDAMWAGEPWLYHSRLSAAMNLKLLDPRAVIAAAEDAYRRELAPLNAVEGFIRQILGWREYVRGIYWHLMPDYLERNALAAHAPLPGFYWTGDTPMRCLSDAIRQTLTHGYAHHIQRLMVTGLFGLLLGVDPKAMHEWYLAMYVDAVEWVELPNTLGMSQYADGGVMGSKPYIASGNYLNRMSNYCAQCPFNPRHAVGEDACPYTTLYWDFLSRHESVLADNPRMALQLRNLTRKPGSERAAIAVKADELRAALYDDRGSR